MASVDLGKELECSVCLNIYTDPVMLKCGHNFCRECIDRVLDTQEGSKGYSCPECREEFQQRPELQRNITLRNILENFRSTQPDQKETGIHCNYCFDSSVPAVKFCLLCEAYLCNNHLRVHCKSPEHVIADPCTFLESRKCSLHKKIVEYYCTEDSSCICVYCLIGEHKGHQTKSLEEASETKKNGLKNVLQKLTTKREGMEKRVQTLQEHQRKVEGKAAAGTKRVTALFGDLRRQLDDLERRILNEMSAKAEKVSRSLSDLMRQMEKKKDELSRKMRHIEELCNMTDPMTILRDMNTGGLCDTEDGDNEDRERHDTQLYNGDNMDVAGILHMSNTLSDIIKGVNVCFYVQGAADISLDVNTAHKDLLISDDKKTASRSDIKQNLPETPQRFQSVSQVLSSQSFSSGRHYWEVDVGGSSSWRVGMCYPSIERKQQNQSRIGSNNKSWGFFRNSDGYYMIHNSKLIKLPGDISNDRVRIYVDYEAGHISFYSLRDTIQHIHTFTATFTEPLYAGLGVWNGFVKICGGGSS